MERGLGDRASGGQACPAAERARRVQGGQDLWNAFQEAEGYDRTSLRLPGLQVRAVYAAEAC